MWADESTGITLKEMKITVFIAACCLIILSLGCGRQPQIIKLSESSVVVAFGDSLTAGTGANAAESYPSVLANILGCRVVNEGIPGEESSAALKRLPMILKKEKADLVLICEGGNDMLRKQPDEVIRNNLDSMISMARDSGVDVVLIGVPRPGLLMKAPPLYQQLADKHGIPCDSKIISKLLSSPVLKSDYAHPNAAGYKILAESVADLIQKSQRK